MQLHNLANVRLLHTRKAGSFQERPTDLHERRLPVRGSAAPTPQREGGS